MKSQVIEIRCVDCGCTWALYKSVFNKKHTVTIYCMCGSCFDVSIKNTYTIRRNRDAEKHNRQNSV